VKSLLNNLRDLGTQRLLILGGVGVAIIVAIVGLSISMSRSSMTVLYSDLQKNESARIGQVLREMNIAFDIQNDGTAVLVAPEDARVARMRLAERGLPSGDAVGYELFDDTGALGLTSFMQQVTKTRALEGELARTMQTMEGVVAARVHLVLPEREAFNRAASRPSASVFIHVEDSSSKAREKAIAIQRLVSSAVPGLKAEDVTVLDHTGTILAAQGDSGPLAARGIDLKRETEAKMADTVSQLLTPYLGHGNFRVAVTAQLNMDRVVVAEETFDPESQIERSRHNMTESEESNDRSVDPPTTVSQNLPTQDVPNAAGAQSTSNTRRQEETINYEISSVRRERISEGGNIERVNVAVLVDGVRGTGSDGAENYAPRTEEELSKIATIVRTATGFDQSRGDVVTVENVRFQERGMDLIAMGEPGFTEVVMRNIGTIVQSVVLLAIVGLLVMFGLRPLLSRLLATTRRSTDTETALLAQLAPVDGEAVAALGGPQGQALPGADGALKALPGASDTERFVENMIQLKSVEGKVRESSIAKLGEIVEQNPDDAVAILRSWIYEEARA